MPKHDIFKNCTVYCSCAKVIIKGQIPVTTDEYRSYFIASFLKKPKT